jgi:hypothetical protein
MRKRSENVTHNRFLRSISASQREADAKHNRTEELRFYPKQKRTKNLNSIAFEEKYYSERY